MRTFNSHSWAKCWKKVGVKIWIIFQNNLNNSNWTRKDNLLLINYYVYLHGTATSNQPNSWIKINSNALGFKQTIFLQIHYFFSGYIEYFANDFDLSLLKAIDIYFLIQ